MKKELLLKCRVLENVSSNTLECAEAYKVVKLKRLVRKAVEEINTEIRDIYKEHFSEDELPIVFRVESGNASVEDMKIYESLHGNAVKAGKMLEELMKEDKSIEFTPLTFESWHLLCTENNLKVGDMECDLEDIIFLAPGE